MAGAAALAEPAAAQEEPESIQSLRAQAEQGDADAQELLAELYDEGVLVPEDDAEAAKWYRRAAEQGLAIAQYNLGVMYYNGEGVPQNHAEAVMRLGDLWSPGLDGGQPAVAGARSQLEGA